MKIKTGDLTGAQLDWAVAQCEYVDVRYGFDDNCPEYSTDWAQGGPIIEREGIALGQTADGWEATCDGEIYVFGPTLLIAAMRCFVMLHFVEVEVPEEIENA